MPAWKVPPAGTQSRESRDAAFAGEMKFTALLADRLEDNELGSSLSLQNLAAFIE
ncbi:hypothetical protein D187_004731 [Cystobacter fuscus DSM 2262]|uniref:Uncharacterized protein n=1 Tax=Cystobacter fuscus (strain ATCC 25194 / DSM 2262 / NBRC 100088 / M29) TaxID=1242864 RepID=S9P3I5_CYSF2|nr:hypothetical protein [Cystobacter fuscus]EPX57711.1 hypothetical protein D187_004731 [Cystobacter fuscus DSM 2262]